MTSRHIRPALLAALLAITAACARDGGGGDVRQDSAAVDATAARAGADAPRFDAAPGSLADDTLPFVPEWDDTRVYAFGVVRLRLPDGLHESVSEDYDGIPFVTWSGFPRCGADCSLTLSISAEDPATTLDALERDFRQDAADAAFPAMEPARLTLGNEPALRRGLICHDCLTMQYLVLRRADLARMEVSVPNRIGAAEQEAQLGNFQLALSTFRWDTAAPPASPAP